MRFAPQLNAVPGKLSIAQVLSSVNRGLQRAVTEWNHAITNEDEPEYNYGLIVCAMRFFLPSFSPYFQAFTELHEHENPHRLYGLASMALVTAAYKAKIELKLPIVALDIAGAEAATCRPARSCLILVV